MFLSSLITNVLIKWDKDFDSRRMTFRTDGERSIEEKEGASRVFFDKDEPVEHVSQVIIYDLVKDDFFSFDIPYTYLLNELAYLRMQPNGGFIHNQVPVVWMRDVDRRKNGRINSVDLGFTFGGGSELDEKLPKVQEQVLHTKLVTA